MLKEQYLQEDYEMMADHLEQLHKTCMNALESATNGNFLHNKQYVQEIDQSLKVLQALNERKLKRDENTNPYRNVWLP